MNIVTKEHATFVGITSTGHARFTRNYKGWPGSKFKSKHVDLRVRRVMRDGKHDEAQIELQISSFYEKTTREEIASISFAPEEIAELVKALTEHRK